MGKMKRNRVVLHIYDQDFPIATDNSIDYVKALGKDLDSKMREILSASNRVTFAQAAVLAALDYADSAEKAEKSIQLLRKTNYSILPIGSFVLKMVKGY